MNTCIYIAPVKQKSSEALQNIIFIATKQSVTIVDTNHGYNINPGSDFCLFTICNEY